MSISRTILNTVFIISLVGLLGCPSEQEPPVENTPQSETTTHSEENRKTDNLDPDKSTYQNTIQEKYTELEQDIQTLERKASEIPAESQEEFNQMMQGLQRQKNVVKERLDALGASTNEGWEQLKNSTEEALIDLQSAYDKVASRFP